MAGTLRGAIKHKLGLKGKTKPGEMISRMNEMKHKSHSSEALSGLKKFVSEEEKEKGKHMKYKSDGMIKCKGCGAMYKTHSALHAHVAEKHKSKGIKKSGKSFGKSNKLGGGGRFRQVEHAVAGKKGVYNPAGLAAYIGRKSLGKAKFQKLAAKGRAK